MNRTHHNGDLRLENVNEHVELVGWVAKKETLDNLCLSILEIALESASLYLMKV